MRKLATRVVPPTVVERFSFRDEDRTAGLSITTPANGKNGLAATADKSAIVIWNGLLGARRLHAELAHFLAGQLQRPIVTYDDPSDCYDIEHKARRAEAVTRAVSVDQPATVLAYSQAAIKACLVGPALASSGHVNAFGLVAPAGVVLHPEIPDDFKDVDWHIQGRTTKLMMAEFARIPGMVGSGTAAKAAARLSMDGFWYGRRWPSLVREVHSTLKTDGVPGFVTLGNLARIGAMGFTDDRYFPGAAVAARLEQEQFPGQTIIHEGNHVSPVFDIPTAARIGTFIRQLTPLSC